MKTKKQKLKRKIARKRDKHRRVNRNGLRLGVKRKYVLFSDVGQVYYSPTPSNNPNYVTTFKGLAQVCTSSWQITSFVYGCIKDAQRLTKYKDWRPIRVKMKD